MRTFSTNGTTNIITRTVTANYQIKLGTTNHGIFYG